jgi:hypothetical protein
VKHEKEATMLVMKKLNRISGTTISIVFNEAGDDYHECSLHPQTMRGEVIVGE